MTTTKPKPLADEPTPTDAELARDNALSDDELLADMPQLKAPEKLRIRERNRLMRLVMDSEVVARDELPDEAEAPAELKYAMLELVAGIDEFGESIAADKEAYVEWAEGKPYPVFLALMNRYAVALGK